MKQEKTCGNCEYFGEGNRKDYREGEGKCNLTLPYWLYLLLKDLADTILYTNVYDDDACSFWKEKDDG